MAMKPIVNRLEEEYTGRVDFRALNIDEAQNDDAKVQYRFIGQPQFVVVGKDGQVIVSRNGMQRYDTLKADIEKALAGQ
jgi:thioredoxin-like negative regulator of GroEL